jgi:hypothetical protein
MMLSGLAVKELMVGLSVDAPAQPAAKLTTVSNETIARARNFLCLFIFTSSLNTFVFA